MNGVIKVKQDKGLKRFSRKVGRMGNSLGLSLPKSLAEKLDVVQGDEIEFIENAEGEILLKKVRHAQLPDNVRPEVLEAFYDIFQQDIDIFNDLRDR